MTETTKIKLTVKNPLFELLTSGTKVVFTERQCYCNVRYYFGLVVTDKRGRNKFQEVNVTSNRTYSDPVTTEEILSPQWDQPTSDEPYTVVTGRATYNQGMQYLKGYGDSHPSSQMLFIPTFEGLYDVTRIYKNVYDFP
jgi:hypothetical protein